MREGSHGLPAALSPLVTPSKPAVWPHVACSGPLLWRLPTYSACSHPCWLRPGRHPKEQPLAQRPDVIGQPRGHGRRTGPPLLGRARAIGRLGLWPRLP